MTAICGKEVLEAEAERTSPFLIPTIVAITWRTIANGIYVHGPVYLSVFYVQIPTYRE